MKQKKKAVKPVSPKATAPAMQEDTLRKDSLSAWDIVQVCLFSLLLFMAMTVQAGRMSVVLPVLALVLSVGRGPLRRLRERFCVPAIGFVVFAWVYAFAAIYADFGSYAVKEFYKFMASCAVASLVLTRFDRRHVRGLMWVFAAVSAAIGLVSVDAGGNGAVFNLFNGFVEALGGSFSGIATGVAGSRVGGIYNDANVSASILALGCFCAVWLALTEQRVILRLAGCLLLGVNGLSFLLSMSRAAILVFILAALVLLLTVGRGLRLRLFFLLFFTAVAVMGISIPAISGLEAGSLLPDLLLFVCGGLVFLLDWLLGARAAAWMGLNVKAAVAVAAVLVAAAAVYGAAALTVEGPVEIAPGERFFRIISLPEGEYTVSADYEGAVQFSVAWQSELDAVYSTGTLLYDGDLSGAVFEVDGENGRRLNIQLYSEESAVIREVVFSNGDKVPLGRPLMPDFVADRLYSGLFTSSSYIQRVRYLKDGWTLFKQSPVIGHGLGCTEGLLTSVQPYFYESLFLHNHVLQVMNEMGILGLIPFLALLLGGLWLLLRRLREAWRENGGDPLAAALLACWVMINGHSLMEINFSIRGYQCLAYSLLLLPVVLYGRPLVKEGALRVCGLVSVLALWLYLGGFAVLLESHRIAGREAAAYEPEDAAEFMEKTQRWIEMDLFDQEQNKLNFVGNAVILGEPAYEKDMVRYVRDLRASGTYTACTGLAEYYYLPRGEIGEVFACIREAVAQEASNAEAWNQQFDFCREVLLPSISPDEMDPVLEGIEGLHDGLEAYNGSHTGEIILTEENLFLMSRIANLRAEGLEGAEAYMYLALSGGALSGMGA